jgi:hypothetical protein
MDWWALLSIFALFAVICWPISAWFIVTGKGYRGQALASAKWPTAPGTVLSSEVERNKPLFGKDYQYAPKVRYAFEVAGKRYEGDMIQFGMGNLIYSYQADEVVKPYPVGAAVTVHYDPADPKNAVLETSAKSGAGRYWGGWIMTGMPLLLTLLLWGIMRFTG